MRADRFDSVPSVRFSLLVTWLGRRVRHRHGWLTATGHPQPRGQRPRKNVEARKPEGPQASTSAAFQRRTPVSTSRGTAPPLTGPMPAVLDGGFRCSGRGCGGRMILQDNSAVFGSDLRNVIHADQPQPSSEEACTHFEHGRLIRAFAVSNARDSPNPLLGPLHRKALAATKPVVMPVRGATGIARSLHVLRPLWHETTRTSSDARLRGRSPPEPASLDQGRCLRADRRPDCV